MSRQLLESFENLEPKKSEVLDKSSRAVERKEMILRLIQGSRLEANERLQAGFFKPICFLE